MEVAQRDAAPMSAGGKPLEEYARSRRESFVRSVKSAEAYLGVDFTYEPVPGMEITVIPNEEAWLLWDKSQIHMDWVLSRGKLGELKAERASQPSGSGPTKKPAAIRWR